MFDGSRRLELGGGRELVVGYAGERFGWSCYVPGDPHRPILGSTPLAAMAEYLRCAPDALPESLRALAADFETELNRAPRYLCDCCGFRTLLNPRHCEICAVCGWEDDRADNTRKRGGPDAVSGPNRISLTQGRANYQQFGVAKEKAKSRVRPPRPEEHP